VLEKAESGVALTEDSRLQQAAETLRELEGAAVFGDNDAAETEKGSVAEEAEDAIVLRFFGIGRIDESEIEGSVGRLVASGEFFERAEGVERKDLGFGLDFERGEVAADQCGGGGMIFDEDSLGGAAAEGFDADGAGAGEYVEEAGAGYFGSEDIEESFAEAVAGGAQGVALEGFEDAAAIFTGDYAHRFLTDLGQMIPPLPFAGESAEDAV